MSNKPKIYDITATGSTTPRDIRDRFADVINVKDFGAKGDGATDDTTAIQAALDASEGNAVWIPHGEYRLSQGVVVPSYCHVFGDGAGKSVVILDSSAEFTAAFIVECGAEQVEIESIELRGPYYRADGDYTANPVQSIRMHNGVSVRGRFYQQRQNLTREGTSHNINLHHLKIEGFGYGGIHADQINVCRVNNNDISWCGCFGIRFLGCVDHWAEENFIHDIGPGDPDNRNSNRVYGIATNRVYGNTTTDILPDGTVNPEITTIYRRAENAWFCRNRVYNCITWKGLDTHGGKNINFVDNHVTDCHIGIGVDMAGYLERHGYVRVEDVKIIGNTVERYLTDQPHEGNAAEEERYACAAAGINVGAKDDSYDGKASADIFGYNLIISHNNLVGWGEKGRNIGAIHVFNWKNVLIDGNVIRNSRTAAISMEQLVQNCRVSNNVIRDVRDSDEAYGSVISRGISVAYDTIDVTIDGNQIWNTAENSMNGIAISTQSTCKICENVFLNSGAGTLQKLERPQYLNSRSPVAFSPLALGRFSIPSDATDGSTINWYGYGVDEAVLTSTGIVTLTLSKLLADVSKCSVEITRLASGLTAMGYEGVSIATVNGKTVITVYIRDSSGGAKNVSCYVKVSGFSNEADSA